MAVEAIPAWAGKAMRLDPFHLPQEIICASEDSHGEAWFRIGPRGVRMYRILDNAGLPVTVVLPPKAFLGVAARVMENAQGRVTITLELLHGDPRLSVPLLVAGDLDDVAHDWKAWSRAYGLPMLLVEADGAVQRLGDEGWTSERRRQGSTVRQRRPRFLARRKKGTLGLRVVVDGQEIIARK